MVVDELILKLQADLADVKKGLAQVKVDAEKTGKEAGQQMGKAAGTSFGDVFQAVAGAALLNTIKGFFSKAAAEFNKFEAAFLRVDSIAKGFGRSVTEARKQVDELANKGFLNLNQAASSYADAIALGFDEKQARKFIDSLSDIAAFQNTIGNGAEAVQSGLAGLLSNSAEKVENIGVPVKVLNMQYQQNIQTMGKAAALQKFYNGILKESEKFQGDAAKSVETLAGAQNKYNTAVDKSMVAIGKGLEPILKSLYLTGQKLFEAFAKWFGGLDSGTKSIVLLIPLIGAFVVALGTILPVLRAISISSPFGWVALAISGLLALTAVITELNAKSKGTEIAKAYHEQLKTFEDLIAKAGELQAMNVRTANQEKELTDIKEQLRKKAKELGVDYDELAKKTGNLADQAERLRNIEREAAAQKIRDNIKSLDTKIAESKAQGGKADLGLFSVTGIDKALEKQRDEEIKALASIYQQVAEDTKAVTPTAGQSGISANQARFIEAQQKLLEIEKNRLFTIANIKKTLSIEEQQRQIANAEKDAEYQRQALRGSFQQVFAEYIEDKNAADRLALSEQTRQAKRASEEQLSYELSLAGKNEKLIQEAKEKNRQRLAKIDEANSRKQAEIDIESMNQTLQAANTITTGFSQLGTAKTVGSFLSGQGTALSGLSKLSPELSQLGPIGGILGSVGGIFTTITNLFGKSDEDRAREAEEQKRRDEMARAILEEQANYQKSMLALQESQAKLPFEDLQRNLRLIDIQAQQSKLSGANPDDVESQRLLQRQSAIQQTLASQSGTISGQSLFNAVGNSPNDLINMLNAANALKANISPLAGIVERSRGADIFSSPDVLNQFMSEVVAELQRLGFSDVSQTNENGITRFNAGRFSRKFENGQIVGPTLSTDTEKIAYAAISQIFKWGGNPFDKIVSELSTDIGTGENTLSAIEQLYQVQNDIANNTKKTADNTAKALELRPDRERSFIDVGLGFIQSLGQKVMSPTAVSIAQNLASQNFTVPTEIGSANLTATRARTLQERMADALETQITQGDTANNLLSGILRATIELYRVLDNNPGTVSTFDDAAATAFLADRKRRSY